MLEIIPAIDIIDGKCVRLTQGDFAKKKIYYNNPVEIAKIFEQSGIKRLHLVDLDGASLGVISNLQVLMDIASQTRLKIDFGGGIKTITDIQSVFDAGAEIANIGSLAIKEPEKIYDWIAKFGSEKILIGADVKNEMIVINGWQSQTELSIFNFIRQYSKGENLHFFCTDVAKDGLLQGPSLDLYKTIIQQFPGIKLVASGGISYITDIENLKMAGCSGVIIGKALYEGNIRLDDLVKYLE
jgi:phosphoribosylformimino-5-aminoimidazole carboxamide ribotide isomerase